MPLYRRETLPDRLPWVEVSDYEIVTVDRDRTRAFRRAAPCEYLIVLNGEASASGARGRITLRRNDYLALDEADLTLRATLPLEVMLIRGAWSETTILTLFQVRPDRDLEMHYHDGDEYWIFFRGHGTALSEGRDYEVGPGAMIATGMGYEHGFPGANARETLEAVAFETALSGQRRRGHLHREEHGDPVPARALKAGR
jgi:mannose-6-phosphate isomerase-like protein (cupin superfamily)